MALEQRLYFCLEAEVERYSKLKKFPVVYEPCPCRVDSFRVKVREQLKEMEGKEPNVKENIVKSFLEKLPALRKAYKTEEKLSYCKSCGEPSRGEICKMCRMVGR